MKLAKKYRNILFGFALSGLLTFVLLLSFPMYRLHPEAQVGEQSVQALEPEKNNSHPEDRGPSEPIERVRDPSFAWEPVQAFKWENEQAPDSAPSIADMKVELERTREKLREAEKERAKLEGNNTAPAAAIALNDQLNVNPLIEHLSTAPVTYNRLSELWYKQTETVVYRIDPSSTNGPSLPVTLKGESFTTSLPVTPNMSVELTGSAGLDIEPKGKIKKRVSDAAPTSWKWTVTPIDTYGQFLILTTYVHVSDDENSEPYTVKSYEDIIAVNVRIWDHMKILVSTVQPVWIFASVFVTAIVGAYSWIRRKGWRVGKENSTPKILGAPRNNTRSRRYRR